MPPTQPHDKLDRSDLTATRAKCWGKRECDGKSHRDTPALGRRAFHAIPIDGVILLIPNPLQFVVGWAAGALLDPVDVGYYAYFWTNSGQTWGRPPWTSGR
jgi:hypothetical protein